MLEDQLREELDQRRASYAWRCLQVSGPCTRKVVVGDQPLLNFASNDYLGLASDPRLARAVSAAADRFGVGSGSSRLVAGHLDIHANLESRFSRWKHKQASLLFPTGYTANMAVLTSLANENDVILLDKLTHASLIDAARASGATLRVFPHLNYKKLEALLARYPQSRRRFIVTDSVFSMDGDCADLPILCELRDRYDATLVIDEAHATGVLGATGAGLAEYQGVAGLVDIIISTAGKALGSLGGIVSASQVVIDTLINAARSFIYTTAVPPTQVAAIDAALDIVQTEPQRRDHLQKLIQAARTSFVEAGWPVNVDDPTPIIPILLGDNDSALRMAGHLKSCGMLVPAIRPPTVAPGSARLRVSLRADLTETDIARLVEAIGKRNQVS